MKSKTVIDDIFETLDHTTEKHRKFFLKHGQVHPFDLIKDLDLEMLGIYISLLQRNWMGELAERRGYNWPNELHCVQCSQDFSEGDYFRYHGVPLHTRCLEKWMYKTLGLGEKDIRYLARIWGNIYHRSLRGGYNPDEMRILKHFDLTKISETANCN